MNALQLPALTARTVFTACVEAKRDGAEKNDLRGIAGLVEDGAELYKIKGEGGELHTLPPSTSVGGVPGEVMVRLYKSKLVGDRSPARGLYNQLRSAAKYNQCPLCSHRDVSTLDHYLPKVEFPLFAVTPANLVPSCKDCNMSKLASYSAQIYEQFIHPYFDNPDAGRWLKAIVVEGDQPVIRFEATPDMGFSRTLAERIKFHFKNCQLGTLYAAQAAVEVAGIRLQLDRLAKAAGADAVAKNLNEQYVSRREIGENTWRAALYLTLSRSDWFCGGGYNAFAS